MSLGPFPLLSSPLTFCYGAWFLDEALPPRAGIETGLLPLVQSR